MFHPAGHYIIPSTKPDVIIGPFKTRNAAHVFSVRWNIPFVKITMAPSIFADQVLDPNILAQKIKAQGSPSLDQI